MKKSIDESEKNWAILAHLSGLLGYAIPFGNILAPIIIMVTKGQTSDFIKENAKESLNFQISMTIWVIISAVLSIILIGIFGLIFLLIVDIIYIIKATMVSQKGEIFRYPITVRFVK